ncbi:MAG: dienelactone hydrolase family protein [Sphingomonadaceae bacterium]
MITVAALDGTGSFNVYRAMPTGEVKAAIILVQEIFGINPGIRAKVDSWAAKGYATYALDLFWRDKPGIQLDPDVPEQLQEGFGFYQRFDRDKGVADIEATIKAARAETGKKVGVTGYCLGGLMTYLSAARTDSDASAAYYGGGIDGFLGESHGIARPLLMHFAGQDHFIPPEAIAKIEDTFKGNARVEIHVYPGVDHGFATETGKRRVEAAAQLADSRTEAFFARHLG